MVKFKWFIEKIKVLMQFYAFLGWGRVNNANYVVNNHVFHQKQKQQKIIL